MEVMKPMTTEAIALTEKKMNMTLDEIIKMSKRAAKKDKKVPRHPIKSQGLPNGIAAQRRVQHFMDSRASIRQGVLSQRRSNNHVNQFPSAINAARRAFTMPVRTPAIKAPRHRIESQGLLNGIGAQRRNRVQRFIDSRASIRQGVLSQRRSNNYANQFPLAINAARRAITVPLRTMAVNWNRLRLAASTTQGNSSFTGATGKSTAVVPPKQRAWTMDARFANLKENRLRVKSSHQRAQLTVNHQVARSRRAQQQQQQVRGARGGAFRGRWPENSCK